MSPANELMRTAADWFLRARATDAQSDEYVAWLAWMEASPDHRRAFARIQETWDIAQTALRAPSVQLIDDRADPPRRIPLKHFAIAAGVLIAVVSVAIGWSLRPERMSDTQRVVTARGKHQTATLPDGSRVELGGMTAIVLDFTPQRRLVVAEEGEAYYKVERDPRRPFVVRTGDVLVTAIGTAFSVRHEAQVVSITVDEGVVEVASVSGRSSAPVRAIAGERIRVDSAGAAPTLRPSEVKSAEWIQGKLRFEAEPLSVVVASLNRYSQREIVLADPALGELQFSGTVFEDRIAQWLEGIQRLFPVDVRQAGAGRIVLERRDR